MATGSITTAAAESAIVVGSEATGPVEQRFVLYDVDWDTYVAISDALTGRHIRLTYDRGALEFMTISLTHAFYSRLLARLIAVLTEEFGLPIKSCGDMTCRRQDVDRGFEPDECFYLVNEPQMRGRTELNLETDPPPDLGVEVEITRSARKRMGVYAALRILEVWRYNGTALTVHQLNQQGHYEETDRSRYFPDVPISQISRFLEQGAAMEENSLVASFREWVRQQRTP